MTRNQIDWYNAQTNRQHFERSDAETKRHNFGTESISRETNAIQMWFNQQQADHLVRQDAINQGHYERQDYETYRHNTTGEGQNLIKLQNEYELGHESNVIKSEANDISRGKLANETYLVSSEAEKNKAAAEESRARAQKVRKETKYIGAQAVSEIAANYGHVVQSAGGTFKDVVGTIPKLIKIIE